MGKMSMYDVIIVGGGPAGSTLARLLDQKYKVLIIDKRPFDSDNSDEKCCGGLLAPDAQKELARLGLGVPKEVLSGPQMFSVKTIDLDNDLTRFYQRYYINVNRNLFDSWLFDIIPQHVEKRINCCYKGYKQVENGYEVKFKQNGRDYTVFTKILIGADGGNSAIRHQAFHGMPSPEMYVSIQNWYETDENLPYYTSIFDQSVTDFYSWVIQKDHHILIGTAIPRGSNPYEKFNLLIDNLKKAGHDLEIPVKKMGTVIMRTRKNKQIQLSLDHIGLIGEAAGLISPSSAEGISYALKSASYMAEAINQNNLNFQKKYNRKCTGIRRNIWIKNIKSYIIYNPFIRKIVMLSNVLALSVGANTTTQKK